MMSHSLQEDMSLSSVLGIKLSKTASLSLTQGMACIYGALLNFRIVPQSPVKDGLIINGKNSLGRAAI